MQGRRRKRNYDYLSWIKQAERELEMIERLWELGIIKWRDEVRYRSEEIESFYYDHDSTPNLKILRVIR